MVASEKQRKHLEKLTQKGNKHPAWKGGIRRGGENYGYIRENCPSHPYCDSKGYVLQHRLVMERHIGRVLSPKEVVHHINGIKDDNRIENLMLFDSHSVHLSFDNPRKSRGN